MYLIFESQFDFVYFLLLHIGEISRLYIYLYISKNFYQNPFRSSTLNFGGHLEFAGHLELLKDFISGYSYVVMYVEIYSVDGITQ